MEEQIDAGTPKVKSLLRKHIGYSSSDSVLLLDRKYVSKQPKVPATCKANIRNGSAL